MSEATGELEAVGAELDRTRAALRNLMAVVYGDGGHRAAEIGDDVPAAHEAERVVAGLLAAADELARLKAAVAPFVAAGRRWQDERVSGADAGPFPLGLTEADFDRLCRALNGGGA